MEAPTMFAQEGMADDSESSSDDSNFDSTLTNNSDRQCYFNCTAVTESEESRAKEVYILNKPLQCLVISLIMLTTATLNILIIQNICSCQMKQRSINFLLIKYLCLADLLGSLLVLPVPLIITAKGRWDLSYEWCKADSFINVAIWLQHILMLGLVKGDRILASSLPLGRYPVFSPEVTETMGVVFWVISLILAGIVTSLFTASFEQTAVLCIPRLPLGFFVSLLTVYSVALMAAVFGYSFMIIQLRRRQRQINGLNRMRVVDYGALEKGTRTSFLITATHFVLYVPTILVFGLQGWILPPAAVLLCGFVVYSDFLIHPVSLLATSSKLRNEVVTTVMKFMTQAANHATKLLPLALCRFHRVLFERRNRLLVATAPRSVSRAPVTYSTNASSCTRTNTGSNKGLSSATAMVSAAHEEEKVICEEPRSPLKAVNLNHRGKPQRGPCGSTEEGIVVDVVAASMAQSGKFIDLSSSEMSLHILAVTDDNATDQGPAQDNTGGTSRLYLVSDRTQEETTRVDLIDDDNETE